MARPSVTQILSNSESWDSPLNDNFSILVNGPFPIYHVGTVGGLPLASDYAQCLALVGAAEPYELYSSNGTAWEILFMTAAELAAIRNATSPSGVNPFATVSDVSVGAITTGMIMPYGGAVAPTGYLLCDGSEVSVATYGSLNTVLAGAFNTGAETPGVTFILPDLRGRSPIGVGTGAGLTARAAGDTGGEETHILTESEMPSHTHEFQVQLDAAAGVGDSNAVGGTGTPTSSTGGDQPHNNMQPFLAVNYIIKT